MFGPADLCYIIKEKKIGGTFTSKSERFGFYHYVYGLETISQAPIAAYIHKVSQFNQKNSKA